MSLTRRSLLAAAAAISLAAGCRARKGATGIASGDGAAVDVAREAEQRLLAAYDQAIARLDAVAAVPLARARDRHRAHLSALTTHATPGPTTTQEPAGDLQTALTASVATLQGAALDARSGRVAALLASIAAEHTADNAVEAAS